MWRTASKQGLTEPQRDRLLELPKILERLWAVHRAELAYPQRDSQDIPTDTNAVRRMKSILRELYPEIRAEGFHNWRDESQRLERAVEHDIWQERRASRKTRSVLKQTRARLGKARLSRGVQSK